MISTHGRTTFILLILVGSAAVAGLWWWTYNKTHISTEDAFIDSRAFAVSPRISGKILEIHAEDNRQVRKGDLLVALDPANYEALMAEAEADLDLAKNETAVKIALLEAAKAAVSQTEAAMEQTLRELQRAQSLYEIKAVPKGQLDKLLTEKKLMEAGLIQARQKLKGEEASLGFVGNNGQDASITQKVVKLNQAKLNFSYTRMYAPADGYVTKKNTEVGNFVQPGQPLMHIINLDNIWITANYKESQFYFLITYETQPRLLRFGTATNKR